MTKRPYDYDNCSNDCVVCKDRCVMCGAFNTRQVWIEKIREMMEIFSQTYTNDKQTRDLLKRGIISEKEARIILESNERTRTDTKEYVAGLDLDFHNVKGIKQ